MSDTALIVPKEEVEETNKSVSLFQDHAAALVIESPDDAKAATEFLTTIKTYKKELTARKEEITRPLMAGLASVRDLFRGPEAALDASEKVTKGKMLAYDAVVEAEKDRIEGMVEKGTMRADTAVKKFDDLKESKMKVRTVTKVRIVDENLIPREWMIPNMPLITEAVLKKGFEITGVEKVQEKIISA